MKRFYCTVCKKVKRVRNWPILVDSVLVTEPNKRIGQCNKHSTFSVQISNSFSQMKLKGIR